MAGSRLEAVFTKYVLSKPALAVAAAASAVLAVTFSPPAKSRSPQLDPAADAERAYVALQARLGAAEAGLAGSVSDSLASAGARPNLDAASRLKRDLFSFPARGSAAFRPEATTPMRVRPRGLPQLTGLFIDGDSKHAMIDGSLVKEGDTVSGYLVLEISSAWVSVERDGSSHRILLGGNP